MPSPSSTSQASTTLLSGDGNLNGLLSSTHWASGALTYSFPWTSNSSAYFTGYNGQAYSSTGENTAAQHFGFNSTEMAAARSAMAAWSNVANLSFSEVSDGQTNVGDLRFAFTSAGQQAADGSTAWGWANYPNSYWPSAGDVWVSASHGSDTAWGAGSYNLMALEHEVGHALGLKHPFEDDRAWGGGPSLEGTSWDSRVVSIMSYTTLASHPDATYFSYNPTTPMVLDILAIQYLYGANRNYNAGNTTYSFNDNPGQYYFQTIWDGGGSNTISFSGNSSSSIDLREGYGSLIGNPVYAGTYTNDKAYRVYNVWIAYDTDINTVTLLGLGNDTLQANNNGDYLDAGGGNDTVTGGSGNDTLIGGAGNDVLEGGSGTNTAVYAGARTDYTITYNSASGTFTVADKVTGRNGTDSVHGVQNFSFSDGLATSAQLIGVDTTPPVVLGYSPADNATGVTTSATISITFSETVKLGSGSIQLKDASGRVVESFTSSSINLNINGNQLVIRPGSTLSANTTYTLALSAGSVLDLAGNAYAGNTSYHFTTSAPADTTPPTVLLFSPADNATGVATGAAITITFSEAVKLGAGSIQLKDGAGRLVETFGIGSAAVSVNGSQLTLRPSAPLAQSTTYTLALAAGSVLDLAGNAYAGNSSYHFSTVAPVDTTPPTVLFYSPVDNATGVATNTTITLTFSEAVKLGSGTIQLKDGLGRVVESYSAGASALSVSGTQLSIKPTVALQPGVNYTLSVAAGSVLDLAGNAFAGSTSYHFSTASNADTTPPTVIAYSPVDNATAVPTSSAITLLFSEAVKLGSGGIQLKDASGKVVESFGAGSAAITVAGSQVIVKPSSVLLPGVTYTLSFAAGSLVDLAGNAFAGNASYHFTTAATQAGDTTPPSVLAITPVDFATGVSVTAAITVTFSEAISLGAGQILLKDAAGNVVEAFSGSSVGVNGNILTLTPFKALASGVSYTLSFAPGSVLDLAANAYGGAFYHFTTQASGSTIVPTSGNDVLIGTSGNDTIAALDGNDLITGGGGDDVVDGGSGIDTARFLGKMGDYIMSFGNLIVGGATTVNDSRYNLTGNDGRDTLRYVERLRFADVSLALDVAADQPAGKTILMMAATLGPAFVKDKTYAGMFLGYFDSGASLLDGANLLVGAGIMAAFAGAADNASFVRFVYQNVYGSAPDTATLNQAVAALNSQATTQAQWMADLAASRANQDHVALTGFTLSGLQFLA